MKKPFNNIAGGLSLFEFFFYLIYNTIRVRFNVFKKSIPTLLLFFNEQPPADMQAAVRLLHIETKYLFFAYAMYDIMNQKREGRCAL